MKRLVYLLAAVCLAAVAFMLCVIFGSGQNKSPTTPSFTPPAFDVAAVKGVPELENIPDISEFDAGSYKFSVCAEPMLADKKLLVYLIDPNNSGVLLKLRVMDENGETVGESGLIRQGEYLPDVELERSVSKAKIKVMAYEPSTYYSAGSVILEVNIRT